LAPPQTAQPRVIVIGGSLGGLSAALWLRDVGCDVHVFERSPAPLEDRGAGIVLHPATIRYLAREREWDVKQVSAAAKWFRYLHPQGGVAYEEPGRYQFTAYRVLYRGLLGSFDDGRYHLGEECSGFEQDSEGVTVRFASGRVERADLLVCADGINSTGRQFLQSGAQPRYAGYVLWRGTVPEDALSRDTFAALHEAFTYVVTPDSHALAYPIPNLNGEVADGHRLMNWGWYRNVASGPELNDLLTGRDGKQFAASVPPGWLRDDHARRLREDAAALPPPFREMIGETAALFIQVVFDVEVSRMAFGRICLIGDAAFTARPHVAAGTAKAAEDAWTLAQAVRTCDGDVVRALERWESGQLTLGWQLLNRSREAGERLQHGRWHVGESLAFGLYTVGDSVLTE
jgi:2,6-dihydroxypyridine 3-monooxygenase